MNGAVKIDIRNRLRRWARSLEEYNKKYFAFEQGMIASRAAQQLEELAATLDPQGDK